GRALSGAGARCRPSKLRREVGGECATAYAQARRASLLGAGDPLRPTVRLRLKAASAVPSSS
ncbi:MAG: hypothetical protein ACRD2D_06300, partial [Terriglobales bacterium]